MPPNVLNPENQRNAREAIADSHPNPKVRNPQIGCGPLSDVQPDVLLPMVVSLLPFSPPDVSSSTKPLAQSVTRSITYRDSLMAMTHGSGGSAADIFNHRT